MNNIKEMYFDENSETRSLDSFGTSWIKYENDALRNIFVALKLINLFWARQT